MKRRTFEQALAKMPQKKQEAIASRLAALLFGRLQVATKTRSKLRKLSS